MELTYFKSNRYYASLFLSNIPNEVWRISIKKIQRKSGPLSRVILLLLVKLLKAARCTF